MPGKVKVRIFAGRNLPVMDKSSETSDAYVEIKLGNTTFKTEVCRKTLNPTWNTDWFKFEVDDLELQDEPLQIRIMDYDTYSANDSIGRVYIDLGPLLLPQNIGSIMAGWIPIFDTMHGIRGEVNVAVKVDLFSDFNRFRQSSCGVQFFCCKNSLYSSCIPQGFLVYAFHGFVEELVINDDPEYQWIDKIRTPRASNEARQTLFSKLSGEVQRKIGLKSVELGGNAVIGYQLRFDLEGESGIVVRGIGTAVTLIRQTQDSICLSPSPTKDGSRELTMQDPSFRFPTFPTFRTAPLAKSPMNKFSESRRLTSPRISLTPLTKSRISALSNRLNKRRHRSQSIGSGSGSGSDDAVPAPDNYSPPLPLTDSLNSYVPNPASYPSSSGSSRYNSAPTSPTGSLPNSVLHGSAPSDHVATGNISKSPLCYRSLIPEDTTMGSPNPKSNLKNVVSCVSRRLSDSELNFATKGPFIESLGGRSLSKQFLHTENEYPFFTLSQLPIGFIHHLGGVVSANSVKLLGRINNPVEEPEARDAWWVEIRMEIRSHARALACNVVLGYTESTSIWYEIKNKIDDLCILSASGTAAIVSAHQPESEKRELEWNKRKNLADRDELCDVCHIPYSESSIPFPVTLSRCAVCRKGKVPDVLFATIVPPIGIPITGKGCLIQARVCRIKKDSKGEANAKEISDSLPFLQYELHRQLLNKLKVKGMNALFGLKVQVTVGSKALIAIATATAVYLTALPSSQVPKIIWGKTTDDAHILEDFQKQIQDIAHKNRVTYKLMVGPLPDSHQVVSNDDDDDDSNDDMPELDLSAGNKDACVLEMDDSEDVDILCLLNDPSTPNGFEIVNIESVPGTDNLIRNLQTFCRIWRSHLPTGTTSCRELSQNLDNIIQSLFFKLRKMVPCAICNLQFMVELPEDDEIQVTTFGIAVGFGEPIAKTSKSSQLESRSSNSELDFIFPIEVEPASTSKTKIKRNFTYHTTNRDRVGIDISPLSYVPGSSVDKYLGNLNCFFIRESTSVRENGGFGGFVQSFIAEVLAVIRAQVAALGGNALVSYFMNECVLLHNPHKNQGQCLVNVGGDVVQVLTPLQLLQPEDKNEEKIEKKRLA
uniref:C2 domain-containing protein n=1 Tax=Strigamia maritima TaxID=126957 RepID=T1IKZ1_STRMM